MKPMLLNINYRYRGLEYLVADSSGNLYLIPHFRFRRTVYFKQLYPFENKKGGKKNMINYHGVNISFNQLRKRKIPANETIEVY